MCHSLSLPPSFGSAANKTAAGMFFDFYCFHCFALSVNCVCVCCFAAGVGAALPKEQYKQIWMCVNANKLLNKAPANVAININDAASESQTRRKQPAPPPSPPLYLQGGLTRSVCNVFADPDCAATLRPPRAG